MRQPVTAQKSENPGQSHMESHGAKEKIYGTRLITEAGLVQDSQDFSRERYVAGEMDNGWRAL